jgi:hypothetical protein
MIGLMYDTDIAVARLSLIGSSSADQRKEKREKTGKEMRKDFISFPSRLYAISSSGA